MCADESDARALLVASDFDLATDLLFDFDFDFDSDTDLALLADTALLLDNDSDLLALGSFAAALLADLALLADRLLLLLLLLLRDLDVVRDLAREEWRERELDSDAAMRA